MITSFQDTHNARKRTDGHQKKKRKDRKKKKKIQFSTLQDERRFGRGKNYTSQSNSIYIRMKEEEGGKGAINISANERIGGKGRGV